jgi:hypothetical protein
VRPNWPVIRHELAYFLGKRVFWFVRGEDTEPAEVMASNTDLVAESFRLSNHSANGPGS